MNGNGKTNGYANGNGHSNGKTAVSNDRSSL